MAIRMTVLASGSRGNSAVLSSSDTSILIDAGLSCKETLKRMHTAGEKPVRAQRRGHHPRASGTNVNGLAVLARKLRNPHLHDRAYSPRLEALGTAPTRPENTDGSKADAHIEQLELFNAGEAFQIGDIGGYPLHHPA